MPTVVSTSSPGMPAKVKGKTRAAGDDLKSMLTVTENVAGVFRARLQTVPTLTRSLSEKNWAWAGNGVAKRTTSVSATA